MVSLIFEYAAWHYTRAIRDLVNIIGNFLWFFYNVFSIHILLRTLFTPFKRIEEHSQRKLDLAAMAQSFLVNTLMRLVGAMMRLMIISIGLVCLVFTLCAGTIMFFVWLAAPFMLFGLVGMGLMFLAV